MAIPQKGSRKITVDGIAYRWLIRRKATYGQADYGSGKLHVAIEREQAHPGAVLVVYTDHPHPKDWATQIAVGVTPADVAFWIKEALSRGWRPQEPGAQFVYRVSEDAG